MSAHDSKVVELVPAIDSPVARKRRSTAMWGTLKDDGTSDLAEARRLAEKFYAPLPELKP